MTIDEMVEYAVRSWRKNSHDGVLFKVFNADEAIEVMQKMQDYPNVQYRMNAVTIHPYKSFDEVRVRALT